MRPKMSLLSIMLLVMFAAGVSEHARRRFTPIIRVTQPVMDLGVVNVDEVHYRNFEFENLGSRDVVIAAATTPNPGSIEMQKPITIMPGMKSTVKVGLLIRKTAISDAPHTYHYSVSTDDPAASKISLELVAHCKGDRQDATPD